VLTTKLHPYQDSAVDRAVERGSLLIAYSMGLGKTIVSLATIEELIAADEVKLSLLVVPAGVKWQWAQSIAKFTDVETRQHKIRDVTITVPTDRHMIVVDGTKLKRKKLYEQILRERPEFVIISYEQAVNDFRWVRRIEPDCMVLDEATAIKGFQAKRSKLMKRLDAPFRYALTGTPIENRPEEIFSIMEWVDPEVLGRFDLFDKAFIVRNRFGGVKKYKNLKVLHRKLEPAMVRKTRTDPEVAKYLPAVQEDVRRVPLDPSTKALYQRILGDLSQKLADNDTSMQTFDLTAYYTGMQNMSAASAGPIMARTGALLMLCDDPRLLLESAQKYLRGDGEGSAYAARLLESGALEGITKSAKLEQVVADVVDILDGDSRAKVIIFSYFKGMLRALQERLADYGSVTYTGDMNVSQKAEARVKFQQDPDVRLFLSSDAGGYGVDLPEANYLINYDLAWSAGRMDQRNSRHVRVGSLHKRVYVLNYLIDGSIEERTYQMLALKRLVASAVVDGTGSDTVENNVDTLTEHIRASELSRVLA
jgi:SNF2 family DNA or RNA helicase